MKIISHPSPTRWEEYKNLRLEALQNVPQAFLDDPVQAVKTSPEEWQKKIINMYFAEVDSKWIGMIGAYQDEKTKLKHILNVVSFYVSPEYRGIGAGKALLEQVIKDAQQNPEIKKLQLGVVTTQAPAQHVYETLGFKRAGELKYAVKVGETYYSEYLMELYLE
jgi:ribosomal protein S18 acetylase RimI-like enzyme